MADKVETGRIVGFGPAIQAGIGSDLIVAAMADKVEAGRIVGFGPAKPPEFRKRDTPRAKKQRYVERVIPLGYGAMKTYSNAVGTMSDEEYARHLLECGPVHGFAVELVPAPDETVWSWLLSFLRRDPEPVRAAKAIKAECEAFIC